MFNFKAQVFDNVFFKDLFFNFDLKSQKVALFDNEFNRIFSAILLTFILISSFVLSLLIDISVLFPFSADLVLLNLTLIFSTFFNGLNKTVLISRWKNWAKFTTYLWYQTWNQPSCFFPVNLQVKETYMTSSCYLVLIRLLITWPRQRPQSRRFLLVSFLTDKFIDFLFFEICGC